MLFRSGLEKLKRDNDAEDSYDDNDDPDKMPDDLKLELDDGLGWDDYDDRGIPYWDYLWSEDPETGDGWRLVNENK